MATDANAPGSIDYRALLVKYMARVIDYEHVDYIPRDPDDDLSTLPPFTDAELVALDAVSRDARAVVHGKPATNGA